MMRANILGVALVAVACALMFASAGQAGFMDDFDTHADWSGDGGTMVSGNNGWVTAGFGAWTRNDAQLHDRGLGGGNSAYSNPTGGVRFGHSAHAITPNASGAYHWQADIKNGTFSPGGAGIAVGDAATTLFPGSPPDQFTSANHLALSVVSQGSTMRYEWGVYKDGVTVAGSNGDQSDDDIQSRGWFQIRIQGDQNSATGDWRDIDDETGAPIGGWNNIVNYSTIPFSAAGGGVIRLVGDSTIDNVVSNPIPEPASLVLACFSIVAFLGFRRAKI